MKPQIINTVISNLKFLIFNFFFFLFLVHGLSAQNVRYVAAPSGLMLREKPGTDQKGLVKIPYGARIEISSFTSVTSTIDGYEGKWIETSYEDKKGFVFGGYTLPIMPPLYQTDLITYFSNLFGKPVYRDSCKDDIAGGGYTYLQRHIYKNGEIFFQAPLYDSEENTILGLDLTLQQAYLWMFLVTKHVFGNENNAGYAMAYPLYNLSSYPTKDIKNDSLEVTQLYYPHTGLQITKSYYASHYIKFFHNNGRLTIIWGVIYEE